MLKIRSLNLLTLSALFVGLTAWSAQPTQGQAPQVQPKWEYTIIYSVSGTGRNQYVSLADPRETVRAKTLYELYIQTGQKIDSQQFNNAMLFTYLGRQGWELVSHCSSTLTGEQTADTWTFKRRLR